MSIHNGKKMTGAQCLITALEDVGVDTVFGYPGGHAVDIYDALYDSERIDHILVRHEQGAAHAADGYARATGRPGTVIVTSGPGATNTVTGIATAYMDSIPLVVITGQVPTDYLGSDAFQESDMTGITLPIVKHSYLLKDAKDIPETIAQAYHIASTGRPGPVVIDIPSDLAQAQNVVYVYPDEVKIQSYKPTYKGNAKQIKQAARALRAAERPLIYAGGGIITSGATSELMQLASLLQIPVATTLMGRGSFPDDNALNLGMLGMFGFPGANLAAREADLILAVGARFSDRSTGDPDLFAPHAQVIHIDIDPAEIGKNRKADIPIVGDARCVLGQLLGELEKQEAEPRTQTWRDYLAACVQTVPALQESAEWIHPRRVFDMLDSMTDADTTIFTTEVGLHQMWAGRYAHVEHPRTFITSGGAGTMGFGLPAAMGAQLAHPEKQVICIAGDGSLQMCIQEMATIKGNELPVKVLLFDNNCLGMVRQMQDRSFDHRHSQTYFVGNPDFVALAHAYGWRAFEADIPEQLEDAMSSWLEETGPSLLWIKIPSEEDALSTSAVGQSAESTIDIDLSMFESGEPTVGASYVQEGGE